MKRLLSVCFIILIAFCVAACGNRQENMPSRSFFENLDRDSSYEKIVEQIGEGGYEGSGIIYRVWVLDDGSKAKLVFNSKGRIEFIYIVTDNSSERIYDRDNPPVLMEKMTK